MRGNKKRSVIAGLSAIGFSAYSVASLAHHGVNGQFDLSKTLEKTGEVTRIRLVNPHSYVYFDVTEADGEVVNWRCELQSGSLLKRNGWTNALFETGTEIQINGSPARNEPTTCFTEKVTFSDGRSLTRFGKVDDAGNFINSEEEGGADDDANDKPAEALVPKDTTMSLAGDWGEPVPDGPPVAYAGPQPDFVVTQAAQDLADNWTEQDNPRFNCMPTNIILDYRFDQMVNRIEQTDTEIDLTYGFMDVERTIHIDGAFPDDIEPSVTGYSVGTWDDNKLEVMTRGFAPGFLEAIGGRSTRSVPSSEQMEIAETFYVDENDELVHEYTITDPVYLAEPLSHVQKSVRMTGEYVPFNCNDLTSEEGR